MITTVCMNPSFDKTATVDSLAVGGLNRLTDVRYDAGGKGLNVAVALGRLHIQAACVGCLGVADEGEFMARVGEEGLRFIYLRLPGKTRTNLKIFDSGAKAVTEFNEPGIAMDEAAQRAFVELLKAEAKDSRFAVFSGSLPPGCAEDTYMRLMAALPGVDCVLDATGEALRAGLTQKPFLVKPNLPELEGLVKKELKTLRAIRDAALGLVAMGARNAIVSMGRFGAVYTDGKRALFSPALTVDARSTVGAGDAMVAGVLAGFMQSASAEEAFRCGVAAGAASVMSEGTQLLCESDYRVLLPKVTLQAL